MRAAIIEDVTMDDPLRSAAAKLYPAASKDLRCADCGALLLLRISKKYQTPFYGCIRFPACRGSHGAHKKNGTPLGIPANKSTKVVRVKAHTVFDMIWQQKLMTRSKAYAWMRKRLKVSEGEAHIGRFSAAQCEQLIQLVHEKFPSTRGQWDRILSNPFWGEEYDEPETDEG